MDMPAKLTNQQKKTIEFKLRTELKTDIKLREFTEKLYQQYDAQLPQLRTDAVQFAKTYLMYFLQNSDINLDTTYMDMVKRTNTKPSTYYAYRDSVLSSYAWIFEQ